MESSSIPDTDITASSFADTTPTNPADYFAPKKARLNGPVVWCANQSEQNANQWLQIDLGAVKTVSGVAIQGQWKRRVKTYKISYSLDKTAWTVYKEDGSTTDQVMYLSTAARGHLAGGSFA